MRFNLKTTRPVPAATEAGEIWLKRGESIECTAQVAAQLILEDYAEPTDEHEAAPATARAGRGRQAGRMKPSLALCLLPRVAVVELHGEGLRVIPWREVAHRLALWLAPLLRV